MESEPIKTSDAPPSKGRVSYSKGFHVEHYFRDSKITNIYKDTSEIQDLVISRLETGLQ